MNETAVIDNQETDTSTTEQPLSTGAPKIPPAAPPTYEELSERWKEITAAREKVSMAETREALAADNHKEAKKATEAAQTALCDLIDELNRPTQGDLFRAHEESTREGDNKGSPSNADAEQKKLDDEDGKGPDAWRDVPIVKLVDYGMPNRAETALGNAGIDTLGKLADVKDLRDVKGMGDVTRDGLERAVTKFWANNPQYTKPTKG